MPDRLDGRWRFLNPPLRHFGHLVVQSGRNSLQLDGTLLRTYSAGWIRSTVDRTQKGHFDDGGEAKPP